MNGVGDEPVFLTFVDVLRYRGAQQPDRVAFTFLQDAQSTSITFSELDRRAQSVAVALREKARHGERAILLFPPGIEFIVALFGCLYSGVIPVPAYPPVPRRRLPRVQSIAGDAQPVVVLTERSVLTELEGVAEAAGLARAAHIATDTVDAGAATAWSAPAITGETIALLQYTSGSTSTPKGVMVSHGNLLDNSSCIRRSLALTRADISLCWLPSFHDMGLIDGVLQPIYTGYTAFLMAPSAFLQQPGRWLQEISDRKVTHSGGPDFAYALCTKKVTSEQRAGLDLSSWLRAYNGAEPIRHSTLEAFAAAFEPCGFRARSFFPCYGLAEGTLMVSGGPVGRGQVYCAVHVDALERDGVAAPASEGDHARTLVGCGTVLPGTRAAIVDPMARCALPPEQVGEIWIAGPSVTSGYWGQPDATRDTFGAFLENGDGPFLRSGDLGFMRDDELFVTGRLKDMVIIRGRNHYPQDIELTSERSHPALRAGCGAAFTVPGTADDAPDRLAIAFETERGQLRSEDVAEITGAIRQAVAEEHEIQADVVVLLKIGTVPKTSSGKIQRRACRQGFLDRTLQEVGRSANEAAPATAPIESLTRDALLAVPAAQREARVLAYLAQVIAHALRVPPAHVERHESLLKLGMDSLMAIELQHRVASELGAALSSTDFFEVSGAKHVAERVVASVEWAPVAAGTGFQTEPHGTPLSHTQESLWLLDEISRGQAPTCNESVAFQLDGPVRVDLLQHALRLVVERHGALRTTFVETTDGLRARVRDRVADVTEIVDLRHLDAAEASERAAALINDSHRGPFDLAEGPLLRAAIVLVAHDRILLGLTVHHIVADAWSLRIILNELREHYGSLLKSGRPAALPALAAQFSEYARRVRAADAQGDLAENIEVWRRSLEGVPDLLMLPTDRSRPPVQTFRGSACSVSPSRSTVAALFDRCQRECGSTEFLVLLSAYAALLHRYTGQDKIVIGTTVLNRNDADHLGVVGCFVNTPPLVFTFDETTTFRELLTRATESWLEMLRHQEAPFTRVLERLEIASDPNHSPVFQTMMTALGKKQLLDLGEGVRCRPAPVQRVAAKYDLLIYVSELDGKIEFEAEFNADLFEASTVQRILGHYTHLLEQLGADLDVAVARASILPGAERRMILDEWNDTRVPYPSATVVDFFEAQAARTPDAIAVELDNRSLTYDELNRATNRVAHALLTAHGRPGGFIGVYMERSIDMVVALVAIVKAGMAYVPIDPEYPAERIRYMIADSQVPLVLTQDQYRSALAEIGCAAVTLAELLRRTGGSDANVTRTLSDDSRVYMIYTSGSTGRPKGVVNRHGALFNRLYWMQSEYPLAGDDRVLQKTPFSFDVSVWEFFWPLMFGARIVVAQPGGHRDTDYLKRLIRDRQITTLHFVPSMLNAFLEEDDLATYGRPLRRVFCSGEALAYKTIETFYRNVACPLYNLYGPTEAAIDVSYWPCSLEYAGKIVPIGRPIANTKLWVVDKHMQLQPIGVPGELCIGGVALAEGYHNRDDLTRKAFVADPFAGAPGRRMYRTGDLARYLSDGQIEYLGRIDNQIKLRGFRIELGEIEAVVRGVPGVREAAVVLHETATQRMLVAYIVASDFDPQAAREQLKKQLPDFMIPQVFVEIPAIPTSANGKLDRKALPEPLTAVGPELVDAGPATTDEERTLLGIWRDVLGVEPVGIESNFFRLGGDSIVSIRVAVRLRELGYRVQVHEIFLHPTIRELARHLATTRWSAVAAAAALPPFHMIDGAVRSRLPASVEDAWPLTMLQSGMIYHSLLRERSAVYHDIFSYDIQAPVDEHKLRQAIRVVVASHPQLRSSFDLSNFAEPLQLVHGAVDVPVELVDVAALPRHEQDDAIARWTEAERSRDFDPERAPLLRFQIHTRSPVELAVTISFHHAIADGWSVAVVIEELRQLYAALLAGRPIALEPEQAPYSTYVLQERSAIKSEAQAAFWLGRLARASVPTLLGAATANRKHRSTVPISTERTLPAELNASLQRLADQLGLPPKSVFLTLHLHALARVMDRHDVISGLVVNGRPEVSGSERLVGLFLNTIPIALEHQSEDWPARIARVFKLEQDTIAYRGFPLAELLRRSGHKELFDVVFNYTNFHVYQADADTTVKIAGARYFEQTNFSAVAHAHVDPFSGRMTLVVHHDAARIDGAAIARYLDCYLEAAADVGSRTSPAALAARAGHRVAPRPGLEKRMCEIVAAAVGLPSIGIDDHYLELGIDSISAIRVVSMLKRHGVKLSIQNIFEHPTIRQLAAHAETRPSSSEMRARVRPFELAGEMDRQPPPGVIDAYPATGMQLEMIRQGEVDAAQAVYHDVFSYHLALPLDEGKLLRALQQLLDGHETLRTAFVLDAHPVPLQWVFATVAPRLEVFDLSGLSDAAQEALFDRWFEGEKTTRFDVSRPGLIRFCAHRRGPTRFTLSLTFHHAIVDGWSLSLLIADFIRLYAAALHNGHVPVPKVPALKYRDHVRVEVESRRSAALRSFWQDELRDFTYGALPRPQQLGWKSRWSEIKLTVDPARQEALTALCHRLGVPMKHVALAAHLVVMGLLHRRSDVLTAVFVNGRLEEEEGEDVVGMFLNFMPFRQFVGNQTWRALIEATFANDRRRLPYRRYPLESIHSDLGRDRIVDTAFNYTQFKLYGEVGHNGDTGDGTKVLEDIRWFEHTQFSLLVNAGYDLRHTRLVITLNAHGQVLPQWSLRTLGALYDATLAQMTLRENAMVTEPSGEMRRLVAALVDTAEAPHGDVVARMSTPATPFVNGPQQ
jgi:amino acid adenylation domain-containing protein